MSEVASTEAYKQDDKKANTNPDKMIVAVPTAFESSWI